ncbi:MAG: tetratricopeptide repeat protein [Planctomycetota bacterium]
MKRTLWIVAATAAVLLLMTGVYRSTRPTSAFLSEEAAREQLEDLAARFSAAIENDRDVEPIRLGVESIVAQRPEMREGRTLLGQVYVRQGRNAEAYGEFAAALTLEPGDAELQNLAGSAALLTGDLAKAEAHHLLAVRAAPGEARLLLPLADVYLKAERWDDARNVLLRALELELTLHEASALLSDVYAGRGQEGDASLAIQQMEKALAQLPGGTETLTLRATYARKLANRYAAAGEPMEAVAVLNALPTGLRFSDAILAQVAELFDANGQAALAGLQYELALDVRPTEASVAAAAARWYARGGDAAAARAMLDRLERLSPRHPALAEVRGLLDHDAD